MEIKKKLVVSFDAIQCYTDYRYLQQYYILTENYIYFNKLLQQCDVRW